MSRTSLLQLSRLLLPVLAAAVVACGPARDDEDDDKDPGDDTALFLVHSAVETDGVRMNYFSLVDSLVKEVELDYADSLELPGRPRLYTAQGRDSFLIGDGESPVITKYTVEAGELVAGDSVSLQPFGVAALGAQAVLFVGENKAYYKDNAQNQVLVIDLEEMAVEKTLSLPAELTKTGLRTSLSEWAGRDGEAFFTVGWSSAQYDRVEPGSVLVRIDTETDELTTVTDDRCRGISKVASHDGALYFFSGVINGLGYAAYADDDGGQQDCILRISEGRSTFDEDYLGTVADALGERYVGTVVSIDTEGNAWIQVADLEITPNGPGTSYSQWYSAGWSWWSVPVATLDGAVQVPGEPGAYSSQAFSASEGYFITRASSEYGTSTLVNLAGEEPADGLSFPGFALDVAQLR